MPLKKEPPQTLQPRDFVKEVAVVSRLLLIITALGVVAGILFAGFGVVLVLAGHADAQSKISLFGQSIDTSSVGVACIVAGAIVTVLTIRRVLKSFDIVLKR